MLKQLEARWLALFILCLGDLMIVLDMTVVNVALPSIRESLGFSETGLVWVINAYMLAFSGFLLLGGRFGDLFGNREMFLTGISLFTAASLVCGTADSQWVLIVARAVQGVGGAIFSAVALAIIVNLFTEPGERAKAMGFFGFISAGGGAIGVLIGGVLTGAFNWHWIFLINIPVGIIVFLLCYYLLPPHPKKKVSLDLGGAITITAALMLAVYAVVGSNAAGWLSTQTLGLFAASVACFLAFLYLETHVRSPLVPLSIFKLGNVTAVSVIGMFWSVGMFAWFFLCALYLQLVLGYTPLEVGLAFLPSNIIMMVFSLGLSAKIVMRYGTRVPAALGMALIAAGLGLFTLSPLVADFWIHVLPGMLLLGVGAGLAFNPVLLAGMSDIPEEESGLASGVLNTAFMMGGSLGLAVLASLAAAQTSALSMSGASVPESLLAGYHLAFGVGAVFTAIAAVLAYTWIKEGKTHSSHFH